MPPEGSQRQTVWRARDIANACFDSSRKDALTHKLKEVMPQSTEMHKKIWPGFPIPEVVNFGTRLATDKDTGQKTQVPEQAWLPTSLMIATLVFLMSHTKRPTQYRTYAFQALRSMVDQVCCHGPLTLDVMHVHMDGSISWRQVQATSGHVGNLWDQRFFQAYLESSWVADLNNAGVPWVSSPAALPHLVSWVAFNMDRPVSVARRNRDLATAKAHSELSCLSVLSKVAFQLDAASANLGEELTCRKETKFLKRCASYILWTKTGAAMEALLSGADS